MDGLAAELGRWTTPETMQTRDQLIARLAAQPEPQLVRIEEFLAGNDDLGSIGCNLLEHPGMDVFRTVFDRLAARADVESIHAQIAELDPGGDSWPFADTVFVVGAIPAAELASALAPLQPDEVALLAPADVPPALGQRAGVPVHLVWWD